jgi:hypothetical protein
VRGYGFSSWCDNIYTTFGTKNIFKIFLPSLRLQPLSGLEWTIEKLNYYKKDMRPGRQVNIEDDYEIRNLEIDFDQI